MDLSYGGPDLLGFHLDLGSGANRLHFFGSMADLIRDPDDPVGPHGNGVGLLSNVLGGRTP
jgi:hypothetical protein